MGASDESVEAMKTFFIGEKQFGKYSMKKELLLGHDGEHKTYHSNIKMGREQVASVLFIHGFGEYNDRYTEMFKDTADLGYDVHAFDFHGFGYSTGARYVFSYLNLEENFKDTLKCIRQDIPLFILAHSMGGGFLLSQILKNPNLPIAGVILSSPWFNFPDNLDMNPVTTFICRHLPKTFDVN